ncbi:rhomboid family intramembrane serine protease [Bdellovibrio sp. HCB117]|uniref:rhomboid family intramembrane serine protease n=1 Tax=Bdellovibrio sp. HCB117 TaxID=3394359 RepID=UPI0039B4CD9A
MIFPAPEDFRSYTRYPLTITLVVLNVFIFLLIFSGAPNSVSSASLLQKDGLTLTGRLYYQYLQTLPAELLYEKPAWVHEVTSNNVEQLGVLGAYALRDARYLATAETWAYKGDEIQINQWRSDIQEFRKKYQEQLLFRFGLSSYEKGALSWVTYQFSHSNWIHLISNLAFLAVIGIAVEALVGSGALLFLYMLGGIAGGAGFLFSEAHGTVPMVGASASISALLAFYCVAETRKRIRYLYFVSPMPGHYGPIYLPTLLIIPLFLLVDLANFWSTPEGLGGGVAYAAHLGGTFLGVFVALLYRWKAPTSSVLTQS